MTRTGFEWKVGIGIITIAVVLQLVVLMTGSEEAEAKTIAVDDDGTASFSKIQNAIDNASSGDIIRVHDGFYNENIIINKTLTLQGNGFGSTTIHGGGKRNTVSVKANGVTLTGFTISGSGDYHCFGGVRLVSSNATISGNHFTNNTRGILVDRSCQYINITENSFSDNLFGVHVFFSGNISIKNNTFTEIHHSAVHIERSYNVNLVSNSMNGTGITIEGYYDRGHWGTHSIDETNTVNGRPVGFFNGQYCGVVSPGFGQLIFVDCRHMKLWDLNFSGSSEGIILAFSSGILIENCSCLNNTVNGIGLYHSDDNVIRNCVFQENGENGIFLECSKNNHLSSNLCQHNKNGVRLDEGSSGNSLVELHCLDNEENGLFLHDSQDDKVFDCLLENNLRGFDVDWWGDGNISIRNCVVRNNKLGSVVSDDHCLVENCSFENTWDGNGLNIWWGEHNTVRNSRFVNNAGYGIWVTYNHGDGQTNTIEDGNVFENNEKGEVHLNAENDDRLTPLEYLIHLIIIVYVFGIYYACVLVPVIVIALLLLWGRNRN
ncbi:MAG: right-handed parallel beta-helix repeat-containing protein [Thermoplasmata archaeon]|nr:right-handed parallel beta-helix repeat-containing protein [Thermoplasmata archaeon]